MKHLVLKLYKWHYITNLNIEPCTVGVKKYVLEAQSKYCVNLYFC